MVRSLLVALFAFALALPSLVGCAARAQVAPGDPGDPSSARPNILFVQTDDQPQSTLRFMPNVQTRLKGEGRAFTNAWNTYTLCCPARAIELTGRYAHNTGVWGNQPENHGGYPRFHSAGLDRPTYATWLDGSGYATGHYGKYMNGYDHNRFPTPAGWDEFGQGAAATNESAALVESGTNAGEPVDVVTARNGLDFIARRAPAAEPFLLQVDFHAPHVPSEWEPRYDGMFAGERVPRSGNAYDEADVSDKPRYIRRDKPPLLSQGNPQVDAPCDGADANRDGRPDSVGQNDCQYPRLLRSLQTVDAFVADALDALAAQGELSNTYVVYYTDNSNHWGEHRLDYGKLAPYSAEAGFPLYVRGPGIPGGSESARLVGNHDLFPTFAQMAQAGAPPSVDGRSWLSVARDGPAAPWGRVALLGERFTDYQDLPTKSAAQYVPAYESVRYRGADGTPNRLYVRYRDDAWTPKEDAGFRELYDLRADPAQARNLAVEEPRSHTREMNRLQDILLKLRSCAGESCRAAENGG